jgi:hypothetical protein
MTLSGFFSCPRCGKVHTLSPSPFGTLFICQCGMLVDQANI